MISLVNSPYALSFKCINFFVKKKKTKKRAFSISNGPNNCHRNIKDCANSNEIIMLKKDVVKTIATAITKEFHEVQEFAKYL